MQTLDIFSILRISKLSAWIFIALIVVAILMSLRIKSLRLPAGANITDVTAPGIALECARSASDVDALLGHIDSTHGQQNRDTMIEQQYWDFFFIPLYTVFFVMLGTGLSRNPVGLLQKAGLLTIVCILLAALSDYGEDFAIIRVLKRAGGTAYPVWFGVPKWFFFFATLVCVTPTFYSSLSQVGSHAVYRLLTYSVFIIFATGGVFGLLGTALVFVGKGRYLQYSILVAFAGFVPLAFMFVGNLLAL